MTKTQKARRKPRRLSASAMRAKAQAGRHAALWALACIVSAILAAPLWVAAFQLDATATGSDLFGAALVVSCASLIAGDVFDLQAVKDAVEILQTNNAPKWGGDHYVCFLTPHQARGLRDDPDWVAAHIYGQQQALYTGEIGRYEDVRFVETTVMPSGANLTKDPNTGDYVNVGADPNLASGVGGNQTTIYKAIMFGEAAVAHATGLPVELRDNGVEDYGREHGIMWYAIWGQGLYEALNSVIVETALATTDN